MESFQLSTTDVRTGVVLSHQNVPSVYSKHADSMPVYSEATLHSSHQYRSHVV